MKYILMHRETVVAVLSVNDISGTVYRVIVILRDAAPLASVLTCGRCFSSM